MQLKLKENFLLSHSGENLGSLSCSKHKSSTWKVFWFSLAERDARHDRRKGDGPQSLSGVAPAQCGTLNAEKAQAALMEAPSATQTPPDTPRWAPPSPADRCGRLGSHCAGRQLQELLGVPCCFLSLRRYSDEVIELCQESPDAEGCGCRR